MDADRFDAFARWCAARRLTRRTAVAAAGTGFLAAVLRAGRSPAQEAPPAASPGTTGATDAAAGTAADGAALFVQTATAGTFAPNPRAGAAATAAATPGAPGLAAEPARYGAYLLTLEGHSGETIAFADRPRRDFGEVETPRFFTGMAFTAENPPNAALVVDAPQGEDDVLLLELLNPAYDEQTRTLTYEADVLQRYEGDGLAPLAAKQRDGRVAAEFGHASLFIDDCANQLVVCYEGGLMSNQIGSFGPVGFCWSFGSFCCHPCQSRDWIAECNAAFPACNNNCKPRTSGCW